MLKNIKFVPRSSFIILILSVSFIPLFSAGAFAQTCLINICKSAENSGTTLFHFTADLPSGESVFTLDGAGEDACNTVGLLQGQVGEVFEDPNPNWVLDHIECELIGVDFTIEENSVRFECDVPTVNGGCTFFNVRGSNTNIPTLSEWGMIAAAAGLGLVGVFFGVRRRKIQNA